MGGINMDFDSVKPQFVSWPAELAKRYMEDGYWEGHTFAEEISRFCRRDPTAVALVDGDVVFSYAELNDYSSVVGRRLLDMGLRPSDRILLQLPNSYELVLLILACLRTGIVPVMALPAHRYHEISHVAKTAEVKAVAVVDVYRGFDHQGLAMKIADELSSCRYVMVAGSELASGTINLHELLDFPVEAGDTVGAGSEDTIGAQPEDIAVFLLSGGTTGLPKLIPRTHQDYIYNAARCSEVSELSPESVYLAALPISHNFPLACPGILGTFHAGGKVVVLDSPEPMAAFRAIATHGVTHTAVVPAVAQRWMDAVSSSECPDISSLTVLQVGGARIADELAKRVRPVLGCKLQQVFGMAEGLINMTRLDDPEDVICGTQGRPISPGDEILIVDEVGKEVANGESGLLLTRGPYTIRGYYAAEEVNARSFTSDGWYRSGDVVRMDPSGNLIVEGREKDIINRAGEKISAEEVENFVYLHDAVALAAAVAVPDRSLGERICLCVQVKEGYSLTLDDVAKLMEDQGLARFKWPEYLLVMEELPVTAVGKVDKKLIRDLAIKMLGVATAAL